MSGNFMVMLMVGVVIPAASLGVVCVAISVKDHAKKWRRDAFDAEVIFIGVTQIATDLVPLMLKLVRTYGNELQIRTFGVDGAYFASFTAWLWNWAIKRSLRKGVQVEYVLCEKLDAKAEKSLSKLVKFAKKKDYKLHVRVLPNARSRGLDIYLNAMRTRHPTLFTVPNKARAMWLEGKHNKGGKYAYNVRYVSPKAMKGKWVKEFARQSDMLNSIVDACRPLTPSVA